jgi:hypothetical protein
MKYRARLIDPGDLHPERPTEAFFQSRHEADLWAVEVLKNAVSPDAVVNLYMTCEQPIAIIPRQKAPAPIEGEA